MRRLMLGAANEAAAFALAESEAEVGLKLSSLALSLWPLGLSQWLFLKPSSFMTTRAQLSKLMVIGIMQQLSS